MEEYDVVVLGLGVGGEDVAGRLAEAGLAVLGVEARLVGGECPYWACVPTKMMVRAGQALAEARRVPQLAGSVGEVRPDWGVVARRIREEATDDWDDAAAVERLEGKGATVLRGRGRLVERDVVEVDGRRFRARRGVVVATGSAPAVPDLDGLADVEYWTNHEATEAAELPPSVVVLGGGPVGCELAQVLARFGTTVTLLETHEHLLAREEPEAGEVARTVLEADGVRVVTGARPVRVARAGEDGAVTVTFAGAAGPGEESVTAARLLVATGRRVDLRSVGLDVVGQDADAPTAVVDERCRVADGVWAVGDVTGEGPFTHVAMYQSGVVVRDVLGQDGPPADYAALPRVTFTEPEIGAVGLTERAARERFDDVRVGSVETASTTRGWIEKAGAEGFIKLVVDGSSGTLVGATAAGPAGGEVLGALAVAVHARVPVATLRSMIYAYPTLHRGIESALADLGEPGEPG